MELTKMNAETILILGYEVDIWTLALTADIFAIALLLTVIYHYFIFGDL